MQKRSWVIVALTLALMLIFSSCANYINSADDFYGGDVIDAEMLSSIAESVFSSDESLRPKETEADGEDASGNGVSNDTTDEISSDNEDATPSNPEDLPDEEPTNEESTEEGTINREHDGVYYWTESGAKYHKWADCGHLKNSTNILSGTLEEAIDAGKEGLCSSCAKK